jgi:membrane protease YdiL (CAAX protease family)
MKQDRLFLTAGFMPAVVMALLLLLERLLQSGLLPKSVWIVAAAEVTAYLVPLLILRLLPDGEGKKATFRVKGFKRQTVWFVLWMSLTAALLASLVNGGVSALLGNEGYSSASVVAHYGVDGFWPLVLIVVVLPAVVEELFFRGVLFQALERCGTWPALLLSSLAFAMIHGDLHNFAGPLAAGMIYGYMTYVLDSLWPAMLAHLVNNGLMLFVSHAAKTYSAVGIWPYILLIAVFCFCMFLAFSMRALDHQIEKGRIKRLQYRSAGETLNGIFISHGMWLLLLLFAVRILY